MSSSSSFVESETGASAGSLGPSPPSVKDKDPGARYHAVMKGPRVAGRHWLSRLRLWSGCTLYAYVTLHLANHALGLVSLDATEAGRRWFLVLWRSAPGTVALYTALTVHVLLAL